jgi:succinate-semialdehyde dehydrogenase/glutarate-semialdehyde dehydrogenase/succinyl-CoA reductase
MKSKVETVNPSDEEILAQYDVMDKETVDNIVNESKIAFEDWKKNNHYRGEIVHQLAGDLRNNKAKLAKIATKEMGKPIKESLSEIEKCAWDIHNHHVE